MTLAPHQSVSSSVASDGVSVDLLARRLAAAGLGVQCSRQRDRCEVIILGVAGGKSCLTLSASGQAGWHYEPAAGPSVSPAAMTAIIAYLLGAPHANACPVAYRAFPFKGKVGRMLQDRGLTVALLVSEDWESFEATTQIEVTNSAHPRLGTIYLADDAGLDWDCNWRAAFGSATKLADAVTPILRRGYVLT